MTRERRRVKRSVNVGDMIRRVKKSDLPTREDFIRLGDVIDGVMKSHAPAHEGIIKPGYEVTPVSEYYWQHARMLRRKLLIDFLADEVKARIERKAGKPVDKLEGEELMCHIAIESIDNETKARIEEKAGKPVDKLEVEELMRRVEIDCLDDETKARIEEKAGKPIDKLEVEELFHHREAVEEELQAEAEKKELEMRRALMSDEMKEYLEGRTGKNIKDISLEELRCLLMELVRGDPSVN